MTCNELSTNQKRNFVWEIFFFQGFKSQALAVTCDSEHKFELAVQLGDLKTAYTIAKELEVYLTALQIRVLHKIIDLLIPQPNNMLWVFKSTVSFKNRFKLKPEEAVWLQE